MPVGAQRRVGHAGVLDVERRVVRQDVPRLDLVEVLEVVARRGRSCGGARSSYRPSMPRYSMNVEHENCFLAIFASVQRRRRRSGTSRRHGAGEVGVDHQGVGPVRRPSATGRRRPAGPRTGSPRPRRPARSRRPGPRPTRAIASVTAPQPPIGWKTPYSYSRNDRIENRLGQLNGDIPRYFDWNVIASRTRGSRK